MNTKHSAITRREAIKTGAAWAAGASLLSQSLSVLSQDAAAETLVPFLNEPRTPPNRLDWETLDSWMTPQDQVFNVQHYGIPEFDEASFRLEIGGMVRNPKVFDMPAIRALPASDQLMTLECSGNGSSSGFMNAVYNSRWTGARLKPLLESCGVDPKATEIVFYGKDVKEETLRPGTRRELTVEVPFGRSLSVEDAMRDELLLAYDRNGEPMEKRNGAPLRLIVPGWYGVANVKWLTRIEARDERYMGRYMARDYVTVRGERREDEVVFVETSVGKMNLKSVVARVTRRPTEGGRIPLKARGAVWSDGTSIERVEVKLDGNDWKPAVLDEEPVHPYCWRFFSIDLGGVAPGKHTVVSRAVDVRGRLQPSQEDDEIALKKTYWEAYQQWPREIEVEA